MTLMPKIVPFVVCAVMAPSIGLASPISGRVEVIDGDTIAVEGTAQRIRLYGIDAPEGQQTCEGSDGQIYLCGPKAADALASIVGRNGRVWCLEEDRDRYGRIVAVCEIDSIDINAEMVRLGWALEYPQYSDGRYGDAEAEARTANRGLWSGTFVEPWAWRRGDRLKAEKVGDGKSDGCDIKGNISGNGHIFHVPGQEHYARTVIDVTRGERWFCTEEDGLKAGWRKARR